MLRNRPGSGTLETDEYRYRKGLEAAANLKHGLSGLCRSADHSASSELCVETICRLAGSALKSGGSTAEHGYLADAINALTRGVGTHAAQADHSGTQTCAQVIAAQTH